MKQKTMCFNCGQYFEPYHSSDMFCCKRCREKYYKLNRAAIKKAAAEDKSEIQ